MLDWTIIQIIRRRRCVDQGAGVRRPTAREIDEPGRPVERVVVSWQGSADSLPPPLAVWTYFPDLH